MKRIFNQAGVSMVILSASIVTILGIAALVIDVGMTMFEKQKLSNAIDAAALAAMQNINQDDTTVINTANQYAVLNGLDPSKLSITIEPDRKSLQIKTSKSIDLFFARVLGISHTTVDIQSTVKTAPLTAYNGARPLAIADQPLVYNQIYNLKEDSGDGQSGNYGALALGGNGATVYEDNLMNGYPITTHVGDTVYTETGNITQATIQGIQYLINQDPNSTYNF